MYYKNTVQIYIFLPKCFHYNTWMFVSYLIVSGMLWNAIAEVKVKILKNPKIQLTQGKVYVLFGGVFVYTFNIEKECILVQGVGWDLGLGLQLGNKGVGWDRAWAAIQSKREAKLECFLPRAWAMVSLRRTEPGLTLEWTVGLLDYFSHHYF